MVNDYKCNQECPTVITSPSDAPYCCHACNVSRKSSVNQSNSSLWTPERGFWGESGCKLSRADMPDECKSYDCRDDVFYSFHFVFAPVIWHQGKWTILPQVGYPANGNLKGFNLLGLRVSQIIEAHTTKELGKYNRQWPKQKTSNAT